MTVSIIIAVKELNDNLKECLKHCLALDYPDFEIIVLPDKEFAYSDRRVRIIPTGNITAPAKRDFALKEAKGDILAFIDDDAYPEKSWLKQAVKNFEDSRVAAVGGPAITPPTDSLMQKASGLVYDSFGFTYRYRAMSKREVDDYPTCNLLVRRDIFFQAGGFNTNYWPGEDTVLCLEIVHKFKKKIIYDPQVLVYHHRRPLFLPHLKQVASYALHRGYFVKRFPRTSRRLSYFMPSLWLAFLMLGFPAVITGGWLGNIYFSVIFAYAVLVLFLSSCNLREYRDIRLLFLRLLGIISTHLVYGVFFLKGLLSYRLKEEK